MADVEPVPEHIPEIPSTLIGQRALKLRLLTPEQLKDALGEQARARLAGKACRLEHVLVAKGYLTPDQARTLADPSPISSRMARLAAAGTLGKYQLVREVGRGGMSVVFEATDTELQRPAALKVMTGAAPEDSPELDEERFLREARLAARLRHPNIVTVYEAGVIDGQRFIAMEFVRGKSFAEWQKTDGPPLIRRVAVLRDVARAVHYAHEQGVLHRDVKPKNILVGEGRVFVTDFGLAKSVGPDGSQSLTATGTAVGTPAYMSPEQAQARKDVDRRADVYSLGVVLYEILAGRTPFQGESAIEIIVRAVHDPIPPPSKFNKEADRDLEGVCLKATAKDPSERYPTAEAFAADLDRWLGGQKLQVDLPRRGRSRRIATAAAAAAVLLAGGAYAAWRLREAPPAAQAPKAESGPPGEEAWKSAVDLLPLVDVEQDIAGGTWVRRGTAVVSFGGTPARIEVPFRPPEEYDLRLQFTRESGDYCVSLLLTRAGRGFILVLDPRGWYGLERLNGKDFRDNATSVRKPNPMAYGKVYTAVAQVRAEGVTAWLDGELLCRWKTDYSDLSMNPGWALRDPSLLGIGVWNNATVFHRLDIREVKGKGAATRLGPSRK